MSKPFACSVSRCGYRRAVDPFDRQDALRRAAPIDVGNAKAFVVFDVAGHLGDRCGLEPQIHLEIGRVLQVVDDGDGLQAARRRIEALDHARGEIVAVEIAVEALLDVRAQDFDGDGFLDAALHHVGLVNLGDRCGSDGRAEFDEVVFELAAKRALDGAAGFGHRKGLGLVLQVPEIGGKLRADDVGAGREKLTELDVARSKRRRAPRRRASRAVRRGETARSESGSAPSRRARS